MNKDLKGKLRKVKIENTFSCRQVRATDEKTDLKNCTV